MGSSVTVRFLQRAGRREFALSAAYIAAMALDGELATVRTYLDVQTLRMTGRMTYQVSAEPGLERVSIPPLLVQPLVENAVRHGIEPSAGGGRFTVRAETPEGGVGAELWIPAAAREAVAG